MGSKRKKHILFVFTGHLDIGGVERSLLGLLESIDYDNFDVDLFLYGHHGALYKYIDPRVNVLPEIKELSYLRESFGSKIKHGCFFSALLRLRDEIFTKLKITPKSHSWNIIMEKCVPKQEQHYDLAISFFVPFGYLKEKVSATNKVGWVHTDYSTESYSHTLLLDEFCGLDRIAAVSESCADAFKKMLPEMENKVIVIENILSAKFIIEQAKLFSVENEMNRHKGVVNLLSIGRFCTAKNFDNVPFICKQLLNLGNNVRWYIIGFGPDEDLIKSKIQEAKMTNYVKLLGKKDNPYPYISACDIYVQPSRYEGKCVAVREAQILNKPVVITDYATSRSQLSDEVDGLIVPLDNKGCAEGISRLINNKKLIEKLVANTQKRDYTNSSEVSKLNELF